MYYYIVLSCIMEWNDGLNYWDVHRCVEWNNNFALTFPELPRPLRHLPWHTCQVTSVQRSPGSRQGLQSYHASMRVQDRKLVVVQGSFMLFSTAFARKGGKKKQQEKEKEVEVHVGREREREARFLLFGVLKAHAKELTTRLNHRVA